MSDEPTELKEKTETELMTYPESSYMDRALGKNRLEGNRLEEFVVEKLRGLGFHIKWDTPEHRPRPEMDRDNCHDYKRTVDLHWYLDPEYTEELGVIDVKGVRNARLTDHKPTSYGPPWMAKGDTVLVDNAAKHDAKEPPPFAYVLYCAVSKDFVTISVVTSFHAWTKHQCKDGDRPDKREETVYRCPIKFLRTFEDMVVAMRCRVATKTSEQSAD